MAVRAEILKAEEESVLNVEREAAERVAPVLVEATPAPRKEDTATEVKRAAVATFEDVKAYIGESCRVMAERSSALAVDIQRTFRKTREEKPLLIVAVAAGMGLLLGVAVRVWRSKSYE